MRTVAPLARIAWRNVRRNGRHSLGSMLAIAIGFVALGLIAGFLSGMETKEIAKAVRRFGLGTIVVQHRGTFSSAWREEPFRYSLGPAEQAFVDAFLARRAGEVSASARSLSFRGVASTGRSGVLFEGWGQEPFGSAALREDWTWNTFAGKPLQATGPESAVLAVDLAEALDCRAAAEIPYAGPTGAPTPVDRPFSCRRRRVQLTASTESGQVNVVQPEVTGLVRTGQLAADAQFLYLPLALAQRMLDTRAVTGYHVLLRDPERGAAFAAELDAEARAAGLEIEAFPWRAHALYGEEYRRGTQLLGLYRALVLAVVVTIAGMSVFATMLRSVAERTREIGSLRSLGFLRRHVIGLFAMEGALLAALSSAVGLAATLALSFLIDRARLPYSSGLNSEPYLVRIDLVPGAYASAALFLVGVAVLAAVGAARRAARMSISDALLHA